MVLRRGTKSCFEESNDSCLADDPIVLMERSHCSGHEEARRELMRKLPAGQRLKRFHIAKEDSPFSHRHIQF